MGCNKCDIKNMVKLTEKENKTSSQDANLMSRAIYERIKRLEKTAKPKPIMSEANEQKSLSIGAFDAMTADAALARYKYHFAEKIRLKTTTVSTVKEIEEINSLIWKEDDKIYDAKRQYEKLAIDVDPEEELLRARISARKELYNINTPDIPRSDSVSEYSELLSAISEKSEETVELEKGGLLNAALETGGEEDYLANLRKEIKKENPELSDEIIDDLIGA